MFDAHSGTVAERCKMVVAATSGVSAWGIEWLLCFGAQFGSEDSGIDTAARRRELLDQLTQAQNMLSSGIDELFAGTELELPGDIVNARATALNALGNSLENFGQIEASVGREEIEIADILEMSKFHVSSCGAAMDVFLELFSAFQSAQENSHSDERTAVIRSAIREIDNINTMINLIAVNASVEAAHAGVAGKGFSVIASEIQNLSLKSRSVFDELQSKLSNDEMMKPDD